MTVRDGGEGGNAETAGSPGDDFSSGLEWIGDRDAFPSRLTVFDPDPARLDTAWIAVDADSTLALRAMR